MTFIALNIANLVLKGKPTVDGRPGASMKAVDFAKITKDLTAKYGPLRDVDVTSHIQYPKVCFLTK